MGFFGTLKAIVKIATGPVNILDTQLELGGKLLKALIDVNNQVVRIGDEVFRATPGEVFYPGLGPLAGLLKNEIENELIMLNPLGIVPSITIFVDGAIVIGDLLGKVQHRTMTNEELEVARHVFQGSLRLSDEIILTNLAGFDHRPFTVPSHAGGATVNLGSLYVHGGPIVDMPVLIHELTHVWQIQRSLLPEGFLCDAALLQLKNEFGDSVYDYTSGEQWSTYNLEQQAQIVDDWFRGVDSHVGRTLGSPLFRYVNGNVRLGDSDARTTPGGSVRRWLVEAHAKTGSLRQINPPRPQKWWP